MVTYALNACHSLLWKYIIKWSAIAILIIKMNEKKVQKLEFNLGPEHIYNQ